MSTVSGKKIAIVGGGPGGLTLARLLQMGGAQVAVYERDRSRSARVPVRGAEMFSRMRERTADTMTNTEMFYAPDAAERMVPCFGALVAQKRFRRRRRREGGWLV